MSRRKAPQRERNEQTPAAKVGTRRAVWPALRRFFRSPIRAGAASAFLSAIAVAAVLFADWFTALPADVKPTYVGSASCVQCHREEAHQWQGSHHDLAMQRASEATVLADFNDATLTHHDVVSRMFRRDGKFFVNTEGTDGKLTDFEVKYVFGVEPLQQYMVEFDREKDQPENEIARLQVLRLCWNTREKKWFYLPPPDVPGKIDPSDDLHWTGVAQRWNNMCADCHSTNLEKNFSAATGKYHTTFSEISVGCEACHGPGSLHVQIAEGRLAFWDRRHGLGLAALKTQSNTAQIEACAPCHSRRRTIAEGFHAGKTYDDHFDCAVLDDLNYHADGQIKDEVYEFGSFTQSKMFHKNIRCTDCHDPHTAKLKREGNRLCTECHVNPSAHPAGKYDTPAHHHHDPDSPGASCVECHMPETTYMEIDDRRDHNLRTPRPDLSVALGTPNACTRCHLKKAELPDEKKNQFKQYNDWVVAAQGDAAVREALLKVDTWAKENVQRWYNKQPANKAAKETAKLGEHFAYAFDAAQKRDPNAGERLIAVLENQQFPAIVRATAASRLANYDSFDSRTALKKALKDESPQVRAAAVGALAAWPERLIGSAAPLLEDKSRLVRTEAARVLSPVAMNLSTSRQRSAFDNALDEYADSLMLNNDRAGAHASLGVLYENLGEERRAERAYRTAIRVEPNFTGPRGNLASLLDRQRERAEKRATEAIMRSDSAAEAKAKKAAVAAGSEAAKLRQEELELLARDVRLAESVNLSAPDRASIQYRYGLALYLQGRLQESEEALAAACRLDGQSADYAFALAALYQKLERWPEAIQEAKRALALRPASEDAASLLRELEGLAPTSH